MSRPDRERVRQIESEALSKLSETCRRICEPRKRRSLTIQANLGWSVLMSFWLAVINSHDSRWARVTYRQS